jgi:NADPH:quinone reductase-like Zn-dependent oxidoreductase
MKRMRGIQLTGHGGPELLRFRDDLPVPEPGPGEVLVRVGAAAVNNTDINLRTGWYARDGGGGGWTGTAVRFPIIQGIDACGRIEAVGPGVDPGRIGERVLVEPCLRERGGRKLARPEFLGSDCDGAFAEYVAVAARHAVAVRSGLSDVELASFPCSASTAENLLTRAGVGPGERVLVTGASGGVGSAAVQLARARGAEVIAVSQPAKAAALRTLGAAMVIGRDEVPAARLGEASIDCVIDLVGGAAFPGLIAVLRPGGRYAVSGAIGGAEVTLDLRALYLGDLTLHGCTVLGEGVFAALVRRIEAGEIRPLVAATFPLEAIAAAQAAFQDKAHVGKIVLTVMR